ncbi:MAG TPA: ABC transporter permease [Planctomycetota bacterium]|nr:ABC transporter permease [Planctomycetota bacterium]
MSKPFFESMEGLEQLEDAPVYSKDYWDLVFEQLGKRRLFKIGMVVLALLYGVAIYAPLIANDRPFRFEGVDLKAYNGALSQLASIPAVIGGVIKTSDEDFRTNLERSGTLGDADKTPQTRVAQVQAETDNLDERVAILLRYLPPEEAEARQGLTDLKAKAREGATAFAAGNTEAALAAFDEAKKSARAYKRSLKALDPKEPDQGGMDLVASVEHPLWDDLPPMDVFFMVLWAFVLAWPLWNRGINRMLGGDRDRIRVWRKRKWLGVLGMSLLAALGWYATWGGGGDLNQNSGYKHELYDGLRYAIPAGQRLSQSATPFEIPWTPLRYGIAETHKEEQFRPPTWLKRSRADDQGRYVAKGSMETGSLAGKDGFEATTNPVEVRPGEPSINSPIRHLAGVDELGRDFFTRMIWGSRTSLTVGILSAFLLTLIGVFFGSLAGYFGGWVDVVIMRLIEILQSIPAFYLILMTVAFIPSGVIKPIFAIVIVIALIRWTGTARLVRGEFLRLRDQEFVVAARALGFSNMRTIFRHVLPNAMSPVLVSAAFAVAAGILTESAISFLGFGIKPPEASWGSLVNETKNPSYWWIQVFPGVMIFVTVTCYNLVGDAIRDAMDPKMKE